VARVAVLLTFVRPGYTGRGRTRSVRAGRDQPPGGEP
jgi:hypothetical protein